MNEIKEYKPLEPDYNVQCAVENLKMAYWSNDYRKYAKVFTDAEDIIISAICHHGYTVCKRPQGEWIFNSDSLTDDMIATHYCSICGNGAYSGHDNYCWNCGAKMIKGDAE